MPAQPLSGCVISGKLLSLSVLPVCFSLQNEYGSILPHRCWDNIWQAHQGLLGSQWSEGAVLGLW